MVNGQLNPAPWTYLAQNEYTDASPNDSLPWYLETDLEKLRSMNNKITKYSDQRSRISQNGIFCRYLFII